MARTKKCDKVYIGKVGEEDVEKRSWFPEAVRLELRFVNGEVCTIDPTKFDKPMQTAACFHGFSQKLGDKFASIKDDPDKAYEATMAMVEAIESGNWVSERESSGLARTNQMIEAIVAAKGKAGVEVTVDAVRAKYDELTKEQKADLKKDPRINAEYARIMAERAAARAAKAAEKASGAEAAEFAI